MWPLQITMSVDRSDTFDGKARSFERLLLMVSRSRAPSSLGAIVYNRRSQPVFLFLFAIIGPLTHVPETFWSRILRLRSVVVEPDSFLCHLFHN